jgi:ectoine hydroxylase-related dioxygenase (phytanoyl-CoA dioxygenase family)
MSSSMTTLSNKATLDEVLQIMDRDGAVIVERLIPESLVDEALGELEPYIANTPTGSHEFSGTKTTRTGALVARSKAIRKVLMNELLLGGAKAFLKPWSEMIQLNLAQVMRLLPGEVAQQLHRDRAIWGRHLPREIEPQFITIMAFTDFTKENGATRVVPGSHRWDWDRKADDSEVTQAVMPKGSAMFYSGTVLHGGGANRSNAHRIALHMAYCLAWLRQEENMYLSCPPDVAAQLEPEMQDLLGYTMGNYALGYYSPPFEKRPSKAGIWTPEMALGAAKGRISKADIF